MAELDEDTDGTGLGATCVDRRGLALARRRRDQIADFVSGYGDLTETARAQKRNLLIEDLRAAVRTIAERTVCHRRAVELLLLLDTLRTRLEQDPTGADVRWTVRETLQRIMVTLDALIRDREAAALDDPATAARFITAWLEGDARLLGTGAALADDPDRVRLVARLLFELSGSTTPHGSALWFDACRPQLGDRSPRELLDENPVTAREPLLGLAAGGRMQLDR
jgi:hypothetical protein